MGLFKEKNEINNKTLRKTLLILHWHNTESLFKVITDKYTFYFAVQGTKLLRLSLSEELFNAYVEGFLESNDA